MAWLWAGLLKQLRHAQPLQQPKKPYPYIESLCFTILLIDSKPGNTPGSFALSCVSSLSFTVRHRLRFQGDITILQQIKRATKKT